MTRAGQDLELTLAAADDSEALGARIAAALAPGDVVLLEGALGTGKTTLVRGLVAALGGDVREVCSPTFVLLESYAVNAGAIERVHHADLYRLRGQSMAPLAEVGLGEALDDPAGVTAVEWPEEWPWLGDASRHVVRVTLFFQGDARGASVRWTGFSSA
jgi:tRNA threonylcarbamoyladenosine biosynthesis protein TsaE